MTRSKAKKSNSTSRTIILGCLGLGATGVCLLVVGVGIFIATQIRPVTEQMTVGNLPILVNLVDPTDGRGVTLKNYTPVHSEAIGSNPIAVIQLWVDGIPVDAHAAGASENGVGSAVDFSWQPATYGQHVLLARAVDSGGQTVNSNIVRVNAAGPTSPVNTVKILAETGDTLTTLADQQGMTLDQLEVFNPGLDPNQPLTQDQPITIPIFDPPPTLLDGPTTPDIPPDTSLMPPLPDVPTGPTTPADESEPNPIQFWMGDNLPIIFGIPTPPAAPQLAAQAVGCQVHLYLFDQSTDESGFFVYRLMPNANNFERIATLNANSGTTPLEYIDEGVFGASQYYITSFNPAGESPSNLVGMQIQQDSCVSAKQKGLSLDDAKITVAAPVDQLYCYAAFDNGPWRRMPSKPDTFILPQNGEFDLSPYLNILASPAPTKTTPLDMECWGWRSGVVSSLGKVQYIFKVNEGGPVQIPGQGFILNGNANPQALTLPALNLAGFTPHLFDPAPDSKKIAPPFGLLAIPSPAKDQVQLVWDWLAVGCPAEGTCPYLLEIEGYKVYDGKGTLVATVESTQRTASLPLTAASLIPTQCYQVVAYAGDLESAPTDLACVDAPSPTSPLPSAQILAPFSLNISTDPAECKSHLPSTFLGFFTALCDGAASSKNLILTWNWNAGGCFPSPAGEPPTCQIINDIEGFHVYRSYLNGPGELVETVNNPNQKLAILPPITDTVDCYLVQAFKGSLESGPSNTYCSTFNQQGLNRLRLNPSQGEGFGNFYMQKDCVNETWMSLDFPATSFNNPPADLGFMVGSIHKHALVCDRTIAVWYEGMVGFDLSHLENYTVNKATFLFHSVPGTNLSGDTSIFFGSLNDLETASNEACAQALVVVEGYTNGSTVWKDGEPKNTGGAMWYGSQQVAPGPFGGHVAQDVTSYVNAAIANGQTSLGLIFTADQSHPATTQICVSRYQEFGLTLQLSPK